MPTRMRLIDHGATVHLFYHERFTNRRRFRTFWLRGDSSYVRETRWPPSNAWALKVCERLVDTGHRLEATPATLAQVIRREYRRMRRQRFPRTRGDRPMVSAIWRGVIRGSPVRAGIDRLRTKTCPCWRRFPPYARG